MEAGKAYRKLIAFQRADNLVATVYQVTQALPREELFGLVLQMRRAACSIPMNIAEGYTKSTRKEFYQGIKMACNAVTELEYFVDLTLRLGYITVGMHGKLSNEIDATMRSLYGLLESLQDRKQEAPAPRPVRLAEATADYGLIAFSQVLGPGQKLRLRPGSYRFVVEPLLTYVTQLNHGEKARDL